MSRGSLVERVLGVTDPSNVDQSMRQAYGTLTGQHVNPFDPIFHSPTDPQAAKAWLNNLPIDQRERAYAVGESAEIIAHRNPKTANTLVDWHVYENMMQQYGTKSDGTATALMIGALSPLSARSFVCLAEDVYGAGKSIIVDPVGGPSKTRHGLFIFGSGLELPLEDESVDYVHTNQLLHQLEDPSSPTAPKINMVRRLIREIARVAAPGAEVYMKEALTKTDDLDTSSKADLARALQRTRNAAMFIASAFGRHGMEMVAADIPKIPRSSDYLFDPNRNFDVPGGVDPTRYTIFAKKTPRRLPIAL